MSTNFNYSLKTLKCDKNFTTKYICFVRNYRQIYFFSIQVSHVHVLIDNDMNIIIQVSINLNLNFCFSFTIGIQFTLSLRFSLILRKITFSIFGIFS